MITYMKETTLPSIAALLGARGGKARTEKKIKAARSNIKKALAARRRMHLQSR